MRVSYGPTLPFKVGDIVRLKTGGPEMTVEAVDMKGPDVICTWVAKTVRRHGGSGRYCCRRWMRRCSILEKNTFE
jgi:uncharacterized protein YodC (DUF2158 family)